MDDYDINSLIESKNEWCIRLMNIFTPCVIDGFKSIFKEAVKLCNDNNENSKYLMTFQNLLVNIPKWSNAIVENEVSRIIESSSCNYIEDLISCVHIIQLKALTSCRVGVKQKKINIQIPNINSFVHNIYINSARKLYLNIYLFEKNIPPLEIQKNNRELELIIKEIILTTIRDNIPVENILKAYLDETEETDTVVEEHQEVLVDEDRLKEQKSREEKLTKNEKEREKLEKEKLEKEKLNEIIEKQDVLVDINKSVEKVKEDLPTILDTTTVKNNITNQQKPSDNSIDNILSNENNTNNNNTNNEIYNEINNDTKDFLKIEENDLKQNLDILELNDLDNKEDSIELLDIEELN